MTKGTPVTYTLWDKDSNNAVGSYGSAEEAHRVRRKLIAANPYMTSIVEDLVVFCEGADDKPHVLVNETGEPIEA